MKIEKGYLISGKLSINIEHAKTLTKDEFTNLAVGNVADDVNELWNAIGGKDEPVNITSKPNKKP